MKKSLNINQDIEVNYSFQTSGATTDDLFERCKDFWVGRGFTFDPVKKVFKKGSFFSNSYSFDMSKVKREIKLVIDRDEIKYHSKVFGKLQMFTPSNLAFFTLEPLLLKMHLEGLDSSGLEGELSQFSTRCKKRYFFSLGFDYVLVPEEWTSRLQAIAEGGRLPEVTEMGTSSKNTLKTDLILFLISFAVGFYLFTKWG